MKVLIVDDEAPARERLRRQLGEVAGCDSVAEAASGEEAIRLCDVEPPDVVLMDVRMPGMGGLEAAVRISALPQAPALIFTTAYDEYALDAYAAGPADYLVKPVRREALARALEKAARPTRAQLAALAQAAPAATGASREAAPGGGTTAGGTAAAPPGDDARGGPRSAIAARTGERLELVSVESVIAFCADNKYTSVVHEGGEVLIDDSLKALEAEFGQHFVRVHRETLVSLRHLQSLERSPEGQLEVRLATADGRALCYRVSRRHSAAVRRRLRHL